MERPHSGSAIDDDELLMRRVPVSQGWYNPSCDPPLTPDAFFPHKNDESGLSVSRAQSTEHPEFHTVQQEAATGQSKHGYFVAIMRVGDLRSHGFDVVAMPLEGNAGHAEIPALSNTYRKTERWPEAVEIATQIAHNLTLRIEGPYPGQPLT